MQLSDVADQLKNGDVLLFRGGLLHSRCIQRWTRSVYSHVGVVARVRIAGVETIEVLEALEGRGVQNQPIEMALRNQEVDWWTIDDPTVDRDAVVRWFWERRGQNYASWRQLVRSFLTTPFLNFLHLPTRIDRNRYFCSFIATEALMAGAWQPAEDDHIVPELMSPGQVARFTCLKRRGRLTVEESCHD